MTTREPGDLPPTASLCLRSGCVEGAETRRGDASIGVAAAGFRDDRSSLKHVAGEWFSRRGASRRGVRSATPVQWLRSPEPAWMCGPGRAALRPHRLSERDSMPAAGRGRACRQAVPSSISAFGSPWPVLVPVLVPVSGLRPARPPHRQTTIGWPPWRSWRGRTWRCRRIESPDRSLLRAFGQHPAFVRRASITPTVAVPGKSWVYSGWFLVEAAESLADGLRRLSPPSSTNGGP